MKKNSFVIVLLVLLFSFNSTQAQLWKQIKNTAQKRAEDKATQKVLNKTDEAVDESFDQIEASMAVFGKNKLDASAVPNSYNFSWKYVMEIKTDDDKAMKMDYLLETDASYFGFNVGEGKGQNMFMILDTKNRIMVTTFGDGKDKMATASKIPDYSETVTKEEEKEKFVFKTLPNKTVLGYDCKGVQATNNEYDMVFYYTNDAKVSFGEMYKNQKNQNIPDAIANYFKPGEKSLLMEMTMKDLNKKNKITTMKCISLEKNNYTFNKADYKFM